MSNDHYVLDWVKMSNGVTFTGVFDYQSDRFIHFFNFDIIEDDPTLILAAIIWKAKYNDIRFSVFCSTYFPRIKLPQVNLINKRGVVDSSQAKKKPQSIKKVRLNVA